MYIEKPLITGVPVMCSNGFIRDLDPDSWYIVGVYSAEKYPFIQIEFS